MSTATTERPTEPATRLPSQHGSTFWRTGRGRERAFAWSLTVALLALVLAPVVMVLYKGFDVAEPGEPFRFGLGNWKAVLAVPGVADALVNTVTITAVRVTLGMAVAVGLAWLLTRTNIPGAKWLEFACWVGFFMPPLAVIQGWIFLAGGRTGLLNILLDKVPLLSAIDLNVYSYWGIVWVHLMSLNLTTLVVLLIPIFRNMDTSLEEAAYACGATRRQMVSRVFLPMMRPVLIFLTILAVIKAMQSYEVERILGGPAEIDVYATILIRMVFSEPPFIEQGSALSSLVLIVLLPLVFLQRRHTRGQYTTVSSKMKTTKADLGRWRYPIFGLVAGLVALLTVVPFASTLAGSFMRRWGYFNVDAPWTTARWVEVLNNDDFRMALFSTLKFGLLAGVIGAMVMYLVAYAIIRISFAGQGVLDLASWLPWAVPGVLLSLGISAVVLDVPVFRILNGGSAIVVVALVLYAFPTGTQLLKTAILQVNKEMEEAASVAGVGRVMRQVRVMMPMLFPTLLAAGLVTFVAALSEVSGILLLASTETRTLSLLSLDYLTGANFEAAAVINCVLVLVAVCIAVLSRAFGIRLGAGGH